MKVIAVEPEARLVIEWPWPVGPATLEWTFTPQPDGTTFVQIANSGLAGDGDALVQQRPTRRKASRGGIDAL